MSFFSSFAYYFERLIAVVRCLSKLNDYTACFSIDLRYRPNLLSPFVLVFLVDANSIYPHDPFNKAILKMCQRHVKVNPDGQFTVVYIDRLLVILRSPYV